MNRVIRLIAIAMALLSVGCIERSVVVKVNNDGSGIVHVRNLAQAGGLAQLFNPASTDDSEANPDAANKMPSEAFLKKIALELGQGVRLKSISPASTPQGWTGYAVVFAFDDVSQLRLFGQLFDLDTAFARDSDPENGPPVMTVDQKQMNAVFDIQQIRFVRKDDTLQITRAPLPSPTETPQSQEDLTTDPFAGAPKSPAPSAVAGSLMQGIVANALKDARIGLFVQIEDNITATNATMYKTNQVTLLRMDLGTIMQQQAKIEELNSLATQYDGPELTQRYREKLVEIEGFHCELNEDVFVR